MVEHPSESPWSSYRCNALNHKNELVVPHELYKSLGLTTSERQENYSALFNVDVAKRTVEEIRDATNKSWVLGSDYFKAKIEDKINRPMNPRGRGGDRKSKAFKQKIN